MSYPMRLALVLPVLVGCSVPAWGTGPVSQDDAVVSPAVHEPAADAGSHTDAGAAVDEASVDDEPDANVVAPPVVAAPSVIAPIVEAGPTQVEASAPACVIQSGACIGTSGHTMWTCSGPYAAPPNCLSVGQQTFCCPCQIDPVDYSACY